MHNCPPQPHSTCILLPQFVGFAGFFRLHGHFDCISRTVFAWQCSQPGVTEKEVGGRQDRANSPVGPHLQCWTSRTLVSATPSFCFSFHVAAFWVLHHRLYVLPLPSSVDFVSWPPPLSIYFLACTPLSFSSSTFLHLSHFHNSLLSLYLLLKLWRVPTEMRSEKKNKNLGHLQKNNG